MGKAKAGSDEAERMTIAVRRHLAFAAWIEPENASSDQPSFRSFYGLAFALAAAIILALVLMYPSASAHLPGRVETNRAGAGAW